MAKAVRSVGDSRRRERQRDTTRLIELATRLEQLGRAQEAARGVAFDDDPDYTAAFDQLFTAVALLNPMYVAAEIAKLRNESSRGATQAR